MAIQSVEELLQALREHPEWAAQLGQVVLPADRLDRVEERLDRIEAHLEALAAAQQRTEERLGVVAERLDSLAAAQQATEVRLQGLVEQVSTVAARTDRAIGYLVEQTYRSKAHAYFQRIARRIHLLTFEELDDLLEPAVERGDISDIDAEHVRWADAVIRGRRDGEVVYLVLEASVMVDVDDIRRAEHRARAVAKAAGAPALGIAAGEKIMPEAALAAKAQGVWLISDGYVEAPSAA